MDVQDIVERFALMAGLSQEEATSFTYICQDADNEITSKLLPDVDQTVHGARLIAAAAALSFYKYVQYKSVNNSDESVSVGDISIKGNPGQAIHAARDIWLHEKARISDLMVDDEFVFQHVRWSKFV